MKWFITCFAVLTVCFSMSIAGAKDKVIVIPLHKPGMKPNQSCPGENHILGIDAGGNIICGTRSCPGNGPIVGIDAEGNFVCGYKTVFISSVQYTGALGGLLGADLRCNNLARNANLSGVYKAWLSDTSNSPNTIYSFDLAVCIKK